MRSLKHRIIFYLGLILFLCVVSAGTTINAFAAGGSLSETGPASVSATAVTLNGTDQTTTYTLPLTVSDTRNGANAAGWNLTISSTTFSTGGGAHSLSTTASAIKTTPAVVCNSNCQVSPTNSISYPVMVPAGNSPPTSVKFFNAASGTGTNNGSGSFTITPTISIAIPANTFVGSYASTVNVAIVSGP